MEQIIDQKVQTIIRLEFITPFITFKIRDQSSIFIIYYLVELKFYRQR